MSAAPIAAIKANTNTIIGISIAISSQFISNLGSVLQKKAHNDASKDEKAHVNYIKLPLWWIGETGRARRACGLSKRGVKHEPADPAERSR